jgi:hypothetical protein
MRNLVASFLLFLGLALAQYDAATILGTITDPSGSPVANVRITLENTLTGVKTTTTTDPSGNYSFLSQRIGSYRVTAELQGFKNSVSAPFTLTVNARQRVDLALQVGDMTQKIEVSAAAAALETDSSDRGQVITRAAIVNLPLNGRSYADLALLAPGVRRATITNRDASFNVNGLRSSLNNFMIDGVDNNAYGTSNQGFSNQVVQLSPDAVEEFKVQTNNFSAEYGRAGGAVINASVRGGTNEFHGAVWEFLRNTKLNAVGFFKPSTGVKPVLVQNQFGGAFGGPIKKDKMFFFADYEGFRRVERTLQFASIPTLEQRAGSFGIPIVNALNGAPYPNGQLPASEITPFARKVLGDLPNPIRPTNPGALPSNNYDRLVPIPWVDDKGDIRYDHYLSSKLTAFVRYSHRLQNRIENHVIPGNSGGDANGNVRILNQQIATGFNYTLSPTTLLDFRIGISNFEGGKFPLGRERGYMLAEYGIPGLPESPIIGGGLTTQSISGFTTMGRQSSNPQFQDPFTVNPRLNLSRVAGKHTLKAGYEYQLINTNIFDFNPQYGQDNYAGQFSRPSGAASNNLFNLPDFLLGARSAYNLNNQIVLNYRQRMHFAYLQDDFKLSRKLTLNLGVRYEFATPQWEDKNRLGNYDPIANRLVQASAGSLYNRALVNPDFNNWAPRIGFAYQATPKTVVRSGYGISYVHFNRLGGENLLGYNGPSVLNVTINQNPGQGFCTGQNFVNCFRTTQTGYPSGLTDPSRFSTATTRTNYTPADYRTSYVQSWHLTIQRELAAGWILDVAYVGNRSNGLMILGDFNQAVPNLPGQSIAVGPRRPIQGFDSIQMSYGGGFAAYHAFQTKIEKRYANGFYFLNSFTFSKAIDNAAGHLESANGDNSRVNLRNLASEKGLGSYNQPYNNTTSFVWEVPYGHGRKFGSGIARSLDAILGGWRLTGIQTLAAGLPVNFSYSPATVAQVATNVSPTYRPNYVSGSLYSDKSPTNYFNRAAFALPPTSQPFGTMGRNTGIGPRLVNFDGGAHKEFAFTERFRLQFRAEFFNLFNKTNFGSPNANFSNGNFGTITGLASPARQIQFALKLVF